MGGASAESARYLPCIFNIGPNMGGATLKVGGAKKIARALMHGKGVVREDSEHSCQ